MASPDLSAEQREHLRNRHFGHYRNTRLLEAVALKKAGTHLGALDMYLRVAWLDENGAANCSMAFQGPHSFIAPGLMRAIAQGANSVDLDASELRLRFLTAASLETMAFAPLAPVTTLDAAWTRIAAEVMPIMATGTKWRGFKP